MRTINNKPLHRKGKPAVLIYLRFPLYGAIVVIFMSDNQGSTHVH